MSTAVASERPPTPPKSLWELYVGFLSIGARSFGGVLPWAHRVMVEERRWLAPADFAEVVALCQFLPGPNIGNACIVLGRRWFGLRGSIVAFLGLMGLPFFWVLALATLYGDYATHPTVRAVVTGMGIAGAGLFIGTAMKLTKALVNKPAAVVIILGCFVSVGLGRVTLLYVLPVAVTLAILAAKRKLL